MTAIDAIRGELESYRGKVAALEAALKALGGFDNQTPGKPNAPRLAIAGAKPKSLDDVLKAMKGKEPMPTADVVEASGRSQPTVAKMLRDHPTLFINKGSDSRGIWQLTPSGQQEAASLSAANSNN